MNYKDMVFNPIEDLDDADDLMPEGTEIGYIDEDQICYKFTKKAFEKGEVKDLILGNQVGDYDYRMIEKDFYRMTPAVKWGGYVYIEATAFYHLIKYGIYPFYQENKDKKIVAEIVSALESIFDEGIPFDVFSAFWFLYHFACEEYTDLDLGAEIYKKAGEAINRINWPKGFYMDLESTSSCIRKISGYDMGIIVKE